MFDKIVNTIKDVKEIYGSAVDWTDLCYKYRLSESFIREYQDKVDWDCICEYQELSEDFIREFKDKVKWYGIFEYQKLSRDFLIEHFEFIVPIFLKSNNKIDKDVRDEIIILKELVF